MSYYHISDTCIRTLAFQNGIKTRGRELSNVLVDLEQNGQKAMLDYLEAQFQFVENASGLTICKPEADFPEKSNSPESFIEMLINEKYIKKDQFGKEWEVGFSPDIQICSVVEDGSDVFLKLVEGKQSIHKGWYSRKESQYPFFTTAVIHFGGKLIEVRCSHTNRKKYVDYVMKVMGFGKPYKWHTWTNVTKDQAKRIASLLKADLVSTEFLIPSTVGSVRFTADKSAGNVNLRNDPTLVAIIDTMNNHLKLPTNDTNDEVCDFKYTDPVTKIEFPVSFEINIKKGGFKFLKPVTEGIINHVIDAFIEVCTTPDKETESQVAVATEVI